MPKIDVVSITNDTFPPFIMVQTSRDKKVLKRYKLVDDDDDSNQKVR